MIHFNLAQLERRAAYWNHVVTAAVLWLSLACVQLCSAQDVAPKLDSVVADATAQDTPPQTPTRTSKKLVEPDSSMPVATLQTTRVLLVIGAEGTEEYGQQFTQWALRWQAIADANPQISLTKIHQPADGISPRDQLKRQIEAVLRLNPNNSTNQGAGKAAIEAADKASSLESLWIVLIGHGTDNQKVAKFNLIGPDVSAGNLGDWLSPLKIPVVLINCASCSGRFVTKLKARDQREESLAKNRVIVTATRSADQRNFARFGDYFSQAIADPKLDLDKDQQTSLLEAFIAASKQTQDFYLEEKRLATELALIDDNRDGLGTPGDWFVGTRLAKQAKSGSPDGRLASRLILVRRGDEAKLTPQQRELRDRLEDQLESLRKRKANLEDADYFQQLEELMLKLARLYES